MYETFKKLLYRQMIEIEQLERLFHLLKELSEVTDDLFAWLIKYCERHNIPLREEKQLKSYIGISRKIMKEISETTTDLRKPRKLPFKNFDDENPEELPKPVVTHPNHHKPPPNPNTHR